LDYINKKTYIDPVNTHATDYKKSPVIPDFTCCYPAATLSDKMNRKNTITHKYVIPENTENAWIYHRRKPNWSQFNGLFFKRLCPSYEMNPKNKQKTFS
jgi:hypothetical protein